MLSAAHDAKSTFGEMDGNITVVRWGGRETSALREALRLSRPAFAEWLGVTRRTVGAWEGKTRQVVPRLAMQAVLDDALKLAGADARVRFRCLMHGLPTTCVIGGTAPGSVENPGSVRV